MVGWALEMSYRCVFPYQWTCSRHLHFHCPDIYIYIYKTIRHGWLGIRNELSVCISIPMNLFSSSTFSLPWYIYIYIYIYIKPSVMVGWALQMSYPCGFPYQWTCSRNLRPCMCLVHLNILHQNMYINIGLCRI